MSGRANLSLYVLSDMDPDQRAAFEQMVNDAFLAFDSDNRPETFEYDGANVEDVTEAALKRAKLTDGPDLMVIYTTLAGDQDRTTELLRHQLGDDMMVFVTPDGDNVDAAFADRLDNQHPKADQIAVFRLSQLADVNAARREVEPWHNALAA